MKKIVEMIKNSLAPSFSRPGYHNAEPITFVKSRKAILLALGASKESGNLIGVYSRVFGDGMFLTGVDNIEAMARAK